MPHVIGKPTSVSALNHPSIKSDFTRRERVSQHTPRFSPRYRRLDHFSKLAAASLVDCYDLHDQIIPYTEAWRWQQDLVSELISEDGSGRVGSVLLLQHPPVLTLGAGSTEDHLRFDPKDPPLPLHRTERGGEVTYHGPGQVVMYPILNLQRLQPDLHLYLRGLEETIIRALHQVSGIRGERCEGLTGVWVDGAKVAAIGIRARRWVTYHGLALNVTTDLQPYGYIVPCGIADRPVASVAGILGVGAEAGDKLMAQYAEALLSSLADVFGLELVQKSGLPVQGLRAIQNH